MAMLETVSRNLHAEKNGKQYHPLLFLEVLMLGGPRIATFVAINLGGPEIHSIYRWRNQHRIIVPEKPLWGGNKKYVCMYVCMYVDINGGIQESNFKKLGPL